MNFNYTGRNKDILKRRLCPSYNIKTMDFKKLGFPQEPHARKENKLKLRPALVGQGDTYLPVIDFI